MSASRRTFLKSATSVAAPALLAGQAVDRPPNVLYIICDQMRGDAMSCLGHPNARTPNIDALARRGVLMENAFVNGPVCVPSRKSNFSGRYPHEHGSLSNQGRPFLSWAGNMLDFFARRGYRTGWAGKNHTYEREELKKLDFASIRDREPFRAYNGMVPPHWHCDCYWPEDDCYPQVNSDAAVEFLRSNKNDPFFLHVSYFDPHPPYMAPADFASRYLPGNMELPEYVHPRALSDRLWEFAHYMHQDKMTRADMTETLRYYYAQIEWGVDKQVGRLMHELDRLGLAEDTIVLFTSDHGDFMGTHHMVRKGMFLYDSLLHVPMIWSAPGRLPRGVRTAELAQGIDVWPTFAELTGAAPPAELPGRTLKRFLEGERDDPEHVIFTSAGYDELSDAQKSLPVAPEDEDAVPRHTQVMRQNMNERYRLKMARTQEWKLILSESRGPELYHMNGGRVETANVAGKAEHAPARRGLEAKLTRWWQW